MLEEVVAHTLQIITGVLMRNVSLLSAVLGLIFLVVVCGVGIVTTTQLIRTSTTELDHLYYVGLDVCSSVVHTFGSCRRYVLGLFALWFVVLEL